MAEQFDLVEYVLNVEKEEERQEENMNDSFVAAHSSVADDVELEVQIHSLVQTTKGEQKAYHQKYICDSCGKSYRTRQYFIAHFKSVHLKAQYTVECNICGKSMVQTSISTHRKRHEQNPFKCEDCDKIFKSVEDLQKHVTRLHNADNPFLCDSCKKSFKTTYELENHKISHTEDPENKCLFCDKKFKYKISMNRHHKNAHPEQYEPLIFLSQKFLEMKQQYEDEREAEEKTTESILKKFSCSMCDKAYKYKRNLEDHVKNIHKGQRYICDMCGGKTKTKLGILKHLNLVHFKRRRFIAECNLCGQSLLQRSMARHKKLHEQNAFKCEICEKTFTSVVILKQHVSLTHNIKKPFTCDYCNKSFKNAYRLKEHKALHKEVPTYGCLFCERMFRSETYRNMHQNKKHPQEHAEVKCKSKIDFSPKLTCGVCGKTFKSKRSCRKHLSTHIRVSPHKKQQI